MRSSKVRFIPYGQLNKKIPFGQPISHVIWVIIASNLSGLTLRPALATTSSLSQPSRKELPMQQKGPDLENADERVIELMDGLTTVCDEVLEKYWNLEDGEQIERQGRAFGDLSHDTELKADRVLGTLFRDRLSELPGVGRITIEGQGDYAIDEGDFWITVDPLDGSLNYRQRRGTLGMPYTSC